MIAEKKLFRPIAWTLGIGVLLSCSGLLAQQPPASTPPPPAPPPTTAPEAPAGATVERVYTDDQYGFTVNEPGNWQRGKVEAVRVPGEARMVWSPDGTTTITIFVQKPPSGKPVSPWLLLAESEKGLKAALNVTTRESEVRDVGGMKAMWLVVEGAGTGAAIDGKGSVPTIQHWVAVPRAQGDILIFLLITTSGNYSITGPVFVDMLKTVKISGEQLPAQQVEPPAKPVKPAVPGAPPAPGAPGAPGAPATPPPAPTPPPPPPAR